MPRIVQLSSIKAGFAGRRQSLRKLSPDLVSKARDETATQVTRIGLTFLGTAAFCLLSLLGPDTALLGGSEKINVPFAGPVSFLGFMLLGPAVLIVLRIYLQIYVEHSARLDRLARAMSAIRAPTLVPLGNSLIRFFSGLIFFTLLPATMMLFAWKADVFPTLGLGLFSVAAAVTASHVMLRSSRLSWRSKGLRSLSVAIIAGGLLLAFGPSHRAFHLYRANLSGQWLQGENLEGADLRLANLSGANLREAILVDADLSGANLSNADLRGHLTGAFLIDATVTGANLSGGNFRVAIFTRANLSGADLSNAFLEDAHLSNANLSDAKLVGANLSGASLDGAKLSSTNMAGANLHHANLREVDGSQLGKPLLAGADLTNAALGRANLSGANLNGANLSGARLDGANLSDVQLRNANLSKISDGQSLLNLTGADLRGANLSDAELGHTDLSRADLSGANLSGATLTSQTTGRDGAILRNTNLSAVNLRNARLTGADLSDADLSNADLSNADLSSFSFDGLVGSGCPNGEQLCSKTYITSGAILRNANLSGVDLNGAKLAGADLSGVKNLNPTQLEKALCNKNTKLPEGFAVNACPDQNSLAVDSYKRGIDWFIKGDNDRAIADFNKAIALDPKLTAAYRGRGRSSFNIADFKKAAEDFLSVNEGVIDAYAMLWRYLAVGRLKESHGAAELSFYAERLKSKDWPYPVIEFYLNRRTLAEMRGATSNPDEKCEAEFYIGEWYLLLGNTTDATAALQIAADACQKDDLVAHISALAELKRLKP
jgi:uncharacterized protein YjbI with pentapeptide repeats